MYISYKSLLLTIVVNILVHRWWVSKGLRLLIQPILRFHKQHYSFRVGSQHPGYGSQLASLLYSGKPTPQLWLPVRITLRRIYLVLWFSTKRWKILKKPKHLKHNVQSCRITLNFYLFICWIWCHHLPTSDYKCLMKNLDDIRFCFSLLIFSLKANNVFETKKIVIL
jgi:hypothetical protein